MQIQNAVSRAAVIVGGQTRLAGLLGVSSVSVSEWANAKRPVPAKRAVQIERATSGAVTRQELCPDWAEIWPELAQPSVDRSCAATESVGQAASHA